MGRLRRLRNNCAQYLVARPGAATRSGRRSQAHDRRGGDGVELGGSGSATSGRDRGGDRDGAAASARRTRRRRWLAGRRSRGQTLTTSNGSWSNSPTSYGYQWQDCDSSGASCSNISGATSGAYTLASSDVGHTIESVVTATNAGGCGSATSAATAVVTGRRRRRRRIRRRRWLVGQAVQGQTLTTSNGSWSNSPTSYCVSVAGLQQFGCELLEYQWGDVRAQYTLASQRCGAHDRVGRDGDQRRRVAVGDVGGDRGGERRRAAGRLSNTACAGG